MATDTESADPEAAAHCPRCGAEYRAGFDRCADCDVELVAGPAPRDPAEPRADQLPKPPEHPDIVTLCRLPFEDATLLAGALRDAGIHAGTPDYENRNLSWILPPKLFDVLVEKDQLEQAREIAAAILQQTGES